MDLAVYINRDLAKARLARTKLLNQRKEILQQLETFEKEMVNIEKKKKYIQDELNNCNGRSDAVKQKIEENRIKIANLLKKIIDI